MEKVAEKLADFVCKYAEDSEENYSIYKYGFEIGLEMLFCFAVSAIISVYMNMGKEFLIFIIIFIPIRTYAGGLHMQNFRSCFFLSCLIQVGVLMLSEIVSIPLLISWLLIAVSMITLLMIAPVPTINRQIDILESKYLTKKIKFIFLLIVLVNVILTFLSYVNYISLIAMTMIVVLLSAIAGKIKYHYEVSKNKI